MMNMKKFKLFAGLSGGFGGASEVNEVECETLEEAEELAREEAIQEYQSYEGMYGVLDRDEVIEDLASSFYDGKCEDVPEEKIDEAYMNEIESWIEYWADEVEE